MGAKDTNLQERNSWVAEWGIGFAATGSRKRITRIVEVHATNVAAFEVNPPCDGGINVCRWIGAVLAQYH
jgi:hypothetical protein